MSSPPPVICIGVTEEGPGRYRVSATRRDGTVVYSADGLQRALVVDVAESYLADWLDERAAARGPCGCPPT